MVELSIATGVFMLVSLFFNRQKTWQGIKGGLAMFINLMPILLAMLALVSLVLFFIPNEMLVKYMGEGSGVTGWGLAAFFGSVSLIPGFIAFPLSSVLIKSGVAYSTIAVFITTLMMVGMVTLPLETRFFGLKTSIVRNIFSLIAALLTGIIMSFFL
jgi:uncharacterized membrane protein YraQ (UPF0718 family)